MESKDLETNEFGIEFSILKSRVFESDRFGEKTNIGRIKVTNVKENKQREIAARRLRS